jgi:hydrogenase maturation protein HypF
MESSLTTSVPATATIPGARRGDDDLRVSRLRLAVRGAVQGVGFRPFVFRLATELHLAGWVNNSAQGVFIEVEGSLPAVEAFAARLDPEKPVGSFIENLETSWLDPAGHSGFAIRASDTTGETTAWVRPDIATCPECVREIFDPGDRRHLYPFTNCTHCGPRFSILESLPYDRANTSMTGFTMCPRCQAEYEDPRHRRFHAQPNACPQCGPHLEFWDADGRVLARDRAALEETVEAIRREAIVAVKGLGGFHLMTGADSEAAVQRLRTRKHREEKPLALMFLSLDAIRGECGLSPLEERVLRSPEAPIVLLRRRAFPDLGHPKSRIAPGVAPGNPALGVMLPYTPLHHLLLARLGTPVVATSGNLSDEPICIDEHEALSRLSGIADRFLVHDRPILRQVDDSLVRVVAGRVMMLRRARGYAPLPVRLKDSMSGVYCPDVLAVGAHLKNTVALAVGSQVFLSQHIGDLETAEAFEAFRRVGADLPSLFAAAPAAMAADAHPDYLSSRFADQSGLPLCRVQHHHAHVLACMADNEIEGPVLGVSWDGTGYGLDGTIWGGEFLEATPTEFARVAAFRPFPLPGGEAAVAEPRRAALGLLHEWCGAQALARDDLPTLGAFDPGERETLRQMLDQRLNSPLTSSAGRLFDAVASLSGLRQRSRFEGQAAMELEFAAEASTNTRAYPITLGPPGPESATSRHAPTRILDWAPLLAELIQDVIAKVPVGEIAARFHNGLVEAIVLVARTVCREKVVLTGGCFQNRRLLEQAIRRLEEEGFRAYWHQRVPTNDGGIALGQVVGARALLARRGVGHAEQQHVS